MDHGRQEGPCESIGESEGSTVVYTYHDQPVEVSEIHGEGVRRVESITDHMNQVRRGGVQLYYLFGSQGIPLCHRLQIRSEVAPIAYRNLDCPRLLIGLKRGGRNGTGRSGGGFSALPSLLERIGEHSLKVIAITEDWCGDAMVNIPILLKLAEAANIEVKMILRDENLERGLCLS